MAQLDHRIVTEPLEFVIQEEMLERYRMYERKGQIGPMRQVCVSIATAPSKQVALDEVEEALGVYMD